VDAETEENAVAAVNAETEGNLVVEINATVNRTKAHRMGDNYLSSCRTPRGRASRCGSRR
jgi:hypothetical protein